MASRDASGLRPGDALLVVDVQRDFLSGGALAVPDGNAVVPVLNRWLAVWHARGLPIVASRDWHPPDHCSFTAQGGPWPPHCLRGSGGAAFPSNLALPGETVVVSKATRSDREAYSAFTDTDLNERLRTCGVRRLFVGGLATEYCVLQTVRDALALGYATHVLADAIRAVNPEQGRRAEQEMARRGAVLVRGEALAA